MTEPPILQSEVPLSGPPYVWHRHRERIFQNQKGTSIYSHAHSGGDKKHNHHFRGQYLGLEAFEVRHFKKQPQALTL